MWHYFIKRIHRGQTIPKLTRLLNSIRLNAKLCINKENQTPSLNGQWNDSLQIIMNQVLPPQIASYGSFRPKGYLTRFQNWPIYPNSSNQYWANDDIIRFLFTITQGVMDPYRSHLQFTVVVDQQSLPVGSLQVDSSAQSFISQSVISSNNIELERITEYDSLACYLTDIGFSQYVCQSRDDQGLGYSSTPTNEPMIYSSQKGGQGLWMSDKGMAMQCISQGTLLPTSAPTFSGRSNTILLNQKQEGYNVDLLTSTTPGAMSVGNVLYNRPGSLGFDNTIGDLRKYLGRFSNVRAEYNSAILGRGYPDGNQTKLQTCPIVQNQTWEIKQMLADSPVSGFNPKAPYKIGFWDQIQWYTSLTQGTKFTAPNTCSIWGYQKPICSQFSRGCNETIISPTVPQLQMAGGKLLPQSIPVRQKTFRVPLLSTIIGLLIPADQFLLIPMQALNGLLVQLTLSRFALFTSGYSDVHQLDKRGMQYMQKRNWKLTNITYNLHLYTFGSEQINRVIQASLVKEIPVSVCSYTLASQFQLPNGQVVRNGWPINFQAESVCQVIAFFLANDYQTRSFCRKQFRLSNNITSMQLKFNTQYFPTQPLIGNAGNPQVIDETGDNYPFYQQILLSNNFLFGTNFPTPKINPKSFAINERCYNINNASTFYNEELYLHPQTYQGNIKTANVDTAMGMSSFHENRWRGTAAFVWSFQPYGHSKNMMTGINTYGATNFIMQFNNSPVNPFPRDQTLLMFVRYNTMTIFGSNGVKVIGR